jgi:hypothetical protein
MKPYGYVRKDGGGVFIYGEHQFQNAMGAELVPVYLHPKEWVGLMRGVRVEGDTVVISVKGGNDAARELCGALIEEKNT